MANLFLNNRQRQLVVVDMMHDMRVAHRMNRDLAEFPAFGVLAILPVKSGFDNIALEYLPDSILTVMPGGSSGSPE